jgi:hypothetical protein
MPHVLWEYLINILFVQIFRNILRGRLHHRNQWWRHGRSRRLHVASAACRGHQQALLPLIPVVQREKMGYSLTFLSSSFSKTLLFYAEAPSAENI